MKTKKSVSSITLSLDIESSSDILSRILKPHTNVIASNTIKQFISLQDHSLSDLASTFEEPLTVDPPFEEMMDSFISKYRAPSFNSLDEILTVSNQVASYKSNSVKALSDILDGLIQDL